MVSQSTGPFLRKAIHRRARPIKIICCAKGPISTSNLDKQVEFNPFSSRQPLWKELGMGK